MPVPRGKELEGRDNGLWACGINWSAHCLVLHTCHGMSAVRAYGASSLLLYNCMASNWFVFSSFVMGHAYLGLCLVL